jgi:hypothetical protein
MELCEQENRGGAFTRLSFAGGLDISPVMISSIAARSIRYWLYFALAFGVVLIGAASMTAWGVLELNLSDHRCGNHANQRNSVECSAAGRFADTMFFPRSDRCFGNEPILAGKDGSQLFALALFVSTALLPS